MLKTYYFVQKVKIFQRIIGQKPPLRERYLTHVVELVNEGSEDESQQKEGTWGIFRWVKVHWIADFRRPKYIPLDKDVVMKVDWGWSDTKAKLLNSPNLMSQWGTIDNLRTHLRSVFN
ncbi:hypothetical protein NIES4071_104740 (plasmid) [Calothrix sp. NIES-4071]|nr:hypothetical protein NIES4071_104740 [Calothrix sp. NIES-4071]BAZ64892.1 hypothetical protein NIES4105_106250 [Calothrix sp. NIES-4105]